MQPNKLQQDVCKLLQWTDEEHSLYMLECGTDYLSHYIKNEGKLIVDHILKSKIYWNWWKMNWRRRDIAFVDIDPVDLDVEIWRAIYFELHDPKTLAAQIYPNGTVLGESYNTMIAELNDNVNNSTCKV